MKTIEDKIVDFNVIARSFGSWNVQFRIDVEELMNQQVLLHHLRGIKEQIAKQNDITEKLLMFDGILRKERTEGYVDVVVRIRKRDIAKGSPQVTLKDGIGSDGTSYRNMVAQLDLPAIDRFDQPITTERVMKEIEVAGITAELLDRNLISSKLKEVLNTMNPCRELTIAKGRFPDIGEDAEIEFFFQAMAEPGSLDEYYSSRKVGKGDLLCRTLPATLGESSGLNVKGDILPPRRGLDIQLKQGPGVVLSYDGTEAIADVDGLVVISRQLKTINILGGVKEIPESVNVKVNPVLRVEGNQLLEISTCKTVEVIGNLSMGSRVLTDCEVHITGNIESGTLIEAGDSVIVKGDIHDAKLKSDAGIVTEGSISDSIISAGERVVISGDVVRSSVSGNSVDIRSVSGSAITAREQVCIDTVRSDENQVLTTISIGMNEFYKQRIAENKKFLREARENIEKFGMILGKDVTASVDEDNIQKILLKVLAKHEVGKDRKTAREQADLYRHLLETIPPMRKMIAQKTEEIRDLQIRLLQTEDTSNSMIVVRERIAARTTVMIDNSRKDIESTSGPAEIRKGPDDSLIIDEKKRMDNDQAES